MAERIKDAEDRYLESVFRSEPIDDDGFSERVVATLHRRQWLRRLALPVATLIGGAIAFKPVWALATAASRLLAIVPGDVVGEPVAWMPQLPTVAFGAALLVIGLLGARTIAD